MQAVRYRPEIDGLRAVAVLSVIIFHLNNRWLPGGFLGVDIFFVISGFLITNIILSEIQNGSFSFRDFYTRRIKRIYPAFIAAVSLASVIASQIFLYEDFNQMRKTIELSTVFLSNIYLGFRLGYFDLSANENPVLHIWSLAVEEQYYLLYPLLLIFCYKKTKSLRVLRNISIILFLTLTATSFLPSGFYTDILNQPNTYYLSTLRFPELLVGSLLAVYGQTQNGRRQTANGKRQLVSLLSLNALLICLFVIDKHDPFIPGITLLLPCLLAALLIRSTQYGTLPTRILSVSPIVFVGKISYSLYLYHWIFISFAHYITGAKQLGLPAISSISRSPLREEKLKRFAINQYLQPIQAMGNIEKSNQAVFDLVKDIPNVHWVDAQKYLPKNTVEIHGRYLYSDQDHLTEYGSYYMGREFHKHESLLKHSRGNALQ